MIASLPRSSLLVRLSWIAALWAFCYALYRSIYAFGSTWMLPGVVLQPGEFRFVNAVGAIIVLVGAATPLVMLPMWRMPVWRRVFLIVCWTVAVGCTMHALVDGIQRVLSITGQLVVTYDSTLWKADSRQADLQDLLFNEPWFLIEGFLFAAIAAMNLTGRARWWWFISAAASTAGLVLLGVLAATGITGRFILG